VGAELDTVAAVARQFGVGWWCAHRAVVDYGDALIADDDRLEQVEALGVDEHTFQHATPRRRTQMATTFVDLDRGRLLEVVPGRSGDVVRRWVQTQPVWWVDQIRVAAIDAFRGYATAIGDVLPHATLVIDHFHAIRLGSEAVNDVRRRVQRDRTGHRGHKHDPLYGIRRLLLSTWANEGVAPHRGHDRFPEAVDGLPEVTEGVTPRQPVGHGPLHVALVARRFGRTEVGAGREGASSPCQHRDPYVEPGSSTSGVPCSMTAFMIVHQHTPSSSASWLTGRAFSPTCRHASTPARRVNTTCASTCSLDSVHVRAGHSGCRQRHLRLIHRSRVGRPKHARSRTSTGIRSCGSARAPQLRQCVRTAVVSTVITTSQSASTTSRTRNPGSPNSASTRPIPSFIVRGLLHAAAVRQPQRWSDPLTRVVDPQLPASPLRRVEPL
jgi:Transposase